MMSAAAPSTESLDAQITALGDEIRALKAAKGSKEEVFIDMYFCVLYRWLLCPIHYTIDCSITL
jgi:hypothetical protein